MPYSLSYHYAVADARSQAAKEALDDLPGEVGRLVRKLAAYNAQRRDDLRSDQLHLLVLGPLTVVEDLPCYGDPPEAWRAAYEPYRAALSEVEACDAAFLSLWRRVCDKLLSDPDDDQEAARLVRRIEAQRDAVKRPVGDLQRLRRQLLPDALASWLTAIQEDEQKLPPLEKAASAAQRKAEEARNAVTAVQGHLAYARAQMGTLGREMLAAVEHADKHERLKQLLGIAPPAPVGKVLYPQALAGHVQPLAEPDGPAPIRYVESPW